MTKKLCSEWMKTPVSSDPDPSVVLDYIDFLEFYCYHTMHVVDQIFYDWIMDNVWVEL